MINFDDVKLPVNVRLSKRNPWNGKVKVNNIVISLTSLYTIKTRQELDKLIPIQKYLEYEDVTISTEEDIKIEASFKDEVKTKVPTAKKTRKKKE